MLTVVSDETKRNLLNLLKCNPEKIKVIYNPVSYEFIHHPYIFNTNNPNILHIGTNPNKNLLNHIKALNGLTCTLIIIGKISSSDLKVLENSGTNFQIFHNLSNAELVKKYIECDLLLFSSLFEGFGLPIIEAQSVGRPVITSNISSMPEVSGNAAHLVNPFDPKSIRSGIDKIIGNNNYREELISKGLENASRFQCQIISKQYSDLYLSITDKSLA